VVQLDVDDGQGDEQRELSGPCHALGAVRGVEANRCLHPPMVWHRLWGKCGRCHLSAQILDDATGDDVPRTSEHDVEHLVVLIAARLGVRMAIYGLEVPFGLLEPQSILLVLLEVFLLFVLPLTGRRTVVALLLQLLMVLFCKFLDFPTLLSVVVCRVVHWAMRASVISTRHLMRAVVTLGASAPTHRGSSSYGGGSSRQRLVIATGLLLVVILVLAATSLGSSARIGLGTLSHL
jgi:hypothetical protein